MAGAAEAALLALFRLGDDRLWFLDGRRGGRGERFLLRAAGRFLGSRFLGAAVLFGAATLFLIGRVLGVILAPASLLCLLRRRFGVVLQDPYLFTGSIEDNIRLDRDTLAPSNAALVPS